ncbi:helix-turn-helix domain-containing protein [Hungatella hathewayi]|uniref:helix-turn-helix domain-containing protein n=1 Tax=Hungatella hathewayi TaxID=154046 RepID=UPI003566FF24
MDKYEMKQKVYQSTLKSRALQVLTYLIDRSNKEGTCFPAIATMSRDLHISVSTVKRSLRELTESGFVKKESRFREKNNGQTSNLYILCFFEENRALVEDKAEEKENDDFEKVIPQAHIVIQEEKQNVKAIEVTVDFISSYSRWGKCICIRIVSIYADFCHNLHWPREEVNLIPP